jgi:hypothetical protein
LLAELHTQQQQHTNGRTRIVAEADASYGQGHHWLHPPRHKGHLPQSAVKFALLQEQAIFTAMQLNRLAEQL